MYTFCVAVRSLPPKYIICVMWLLSEWIIEKTKHKHKYHITKALYNCSGHWKAFAMKAGRTYQIVWHITCNPKSSIQNEMEKYENYCRSRINALRAYILMIFISEPQNNHTMCRAHFGFMRRKNDIFAWKWHSNMWKSSSNGKSIVCQS